MRWLALAIALAGCATAVPKPAAQQKPSRPPSVQLDGSLASLRKVAGDAAQPMPARLHAVSEIVVLNDPAADEALRTLAGDSAQAAPVRAAATTGLAQREGPNSVSALSSLLVDADAKVRLAAARGLGMVGGEAAQAALQARLDAETDPAVRDEIQKSLARTTD